MFAVPVTSQAQFTWTTNDGGLDLTSYSGPGGSVTIPASANGLAVTSIHQNAFYNCEKLPSLTIP